jgi:methylase of polypeptide subunit release factors
VAALQACTIMQTNNTRTALLNTIEYNISHQQWERFRHHHHQQQQQQQHRAGQSAWCSVLHLQEMQAALCSKRQPRHRLQVRPVFTSSSAEGPQQLPTVVHGLVQQRQVAA